MPGLSVATTRTIYLAYTVLPQGAKLDALPRSPGVMLIASARLSADERRIENVRVLLDAEGTGGRLIQAPDGTLMIHIPLYQFPNENGLWGPLWRRTHSFTRAVSSVKADIGRRRGSKIMRGTPYSLEGLRSFLCELGFRRVEYRIFPTTSNAKLHSFVFGTK